MTSLRWFLLGSMALAGCKQDEGERCQIDGDCGGDLVCCACSDPPEGTCQNVCNACQDGGSVPPMDEVSVDAPSSEPADAGAVDVMINIVDAPSSEPADAGPVDVMIDID